MMAAATATPPGLGLTLAQAQERWIWGSTKRAFQYRSAKDITTYRYSISDSSRLARFGESVMEYRYEVMALALRYWNARVVLPPVHDSWAWPPRTLRPPSRD